MSVSFFFCFLCYISFHSGKWRLLFFLMYFVSCSLSPAVGFLDVG